jgi:hypothetical protein
VKNLNSAQLDSNTEVVISPPAIYLALTRSLADPKIGVAAQNVYDKPNGAFTGEISVEQLRDAKIDWAVIGHSERRVILKESDEVCVPPSRHPAKRAESLELRQLHPQFDHGTNNFLSSLPARSRPPSRAASLSSSALVRLWRYVILLR